MANLLNTASYPYQSDTSITKMFYDPYLALPSYYSKLAAKAGYEGGGVLKMGELSGMGPLEEMWQGKAITFQAPTERTPVSYYPQYFGLGASITEHMELFDVHGYMKGLKTALKELGLAANHTYETQYADLFNSGFDDHTSKDGNYIFSTSHALLKTGESADNTASHVALSETALQTMENYFLTM